MKALYIEQPGTTGIRDIGKPTPASEEVLLRVRIVGFCGSDLNSFRGKNPLVSFPRIPGHEIAATIEAVGDDVPPQFRAGLNVTLSPYTSCGVCPSCRRGRPNACRSNQTLGVQRDGALTEFVTVPWQKLHVSSSLSLRELSLVEPLTVGFHAVSRGSVTASDIVAVLGCGTVGLGAIAAAKFRNATVIAVDVDDRKLAVGRKAGAAFTINSQSEPLHDRLAELTRGDGPDVVIEAIGLPETFRAAVQEVAFTGRVVYIGYAKERVDYETKLFVQKELDILGSRNAASEDFAGVIQMLEEGNFPVEDTITTVVPLDEAGKTLAEWDRNPGAFTKVLVEVDRQVG
jgi:threonine dehydrogenase-like Zn-dependent dehydrogenase